MTFRKCAKHKVIFGDLDFDLDFDSCPKCEDEDGVDRSVEITREEMKAHPEMWI